MRPVKRLWQNSWRIEHDLTLSEAHELWEQRKAKRVLELLILHEPLAERVENTCDGLLRQAFASQYREILGLHPSQRHHIRAALQNLQGASVLEVLEQFGATTQALKGVV